MNYAIKEYIETVEEYTFENIVLAEIYENFSVDFKEIDLWRFRMEVLVETAERILYIKKEIKHK